MQCPNPNLAVISVDVPIQMVSVQQKANSAMHVEVTTTTLHCASKRNAGKISSEEALCPTDAISAMDAAPAAPHVGTGTEAIAHVAIPGSHPAAPHIVLPMVHPLGTPYIPKGNSTPHRYFQDAIDVIPVDSITTGN